MWVEVDDIQEKHGAPQEGATTQQSHQVAQTLVEQEEKGGSEDPDFERGARGIEVDMFCLLYTSPSPRDISLSRMPSSA